MPYGKSKRTYKKTTKGRSRNYSRTQNVNRIPRSLPVSPLARLKYCDTLTLDPDTGSVAEHVFNANSLFDPDNGLGGHQPMGFDEFASFYGKYVVIGAKMKATFSGFYGGADSVPAIVGCRLSDTATGMTDINRLLEQGRSNHKVLNHSTYSGKSIVINKYFSPKKFFNITDVKDNVSSIGALISANPTNMAHFIIWAAAHNGTADPPAVQVLVEIEYLVQFSEPKQLQTS